VQVIGRGLGLCCWGLKADDQHGFVVVLQAFDHQALAAVLLLLVTRLEVAVELLEQVLEQQRHELTSELKALVAVVVLGGQGLNICVLKHTYARTYIHTRIHTHTCIHTHTHLVVKG